MNAMRTCMCAVTALRTPMETCMMRGSHCSWQPARRRGCRASCITGPTWVCRQVCAVVRAMPGCLGHPVRLPTGPPGPPFQPHMIACIHRGLAYKHHPCEQAIEESHREASQCPARRWDEVPKELQAGAAGPRQGHSQQGRTQEATTACEAA